MKKIISSVLAACVIFSGSVLLTACGIVPSHTLETEWSKDSAHHWHECKDENCNVVFDLAEHTWGEPEEIITGAQKVTCTICGQVNTVWVTTIEKNDWISNCQLNNYTVEVAVFEGDTSYSYMVENAGDVARQRINDEQQYMVLRDGEWYLLEMSTEGNTGTKQNGYPGTAIGEVLFGTTDADELAAVYDTLTYDEAVACYHVTGLQNDDDLKIRIYFKNGPISQIRIDEAGDYQILTISNIGKTMVNAPEFTIGD